MTTFRLNAIEVGRLTAALEACYAMPFLADVEGHVWESVLEFVKGVPATDPLKERTKLLFDVVDQQRHIGWSAKTLQWSNVGEGVEIEFVIQRADILKKRIDLGFPDLDLRSPTAELGAALMKHWHQKIDTDALAQGVRDMRMALLVKSGGCRQFTMIEEPLAQYQESDLDWRWSNDSKTALHGIRKSDGMVVYKWYQNQKQLFERVRLAGDVRPINIEPKRLDRAVAVSLLRKALHSTA